MADEIMEVPVESADAKQRRIDAEMAQDRNSGQAALTGRQNQYHDGKTANNTLFSREMAAMADPDIRQMAVDEMNLPLPSMRQQVAMLPKAACHGNKHGPYHSVLARIGFTDDNPNQSVVPAQTTSLQKSLGLKAPQMSMALNGPTGPVMDFAL